MRRDLREKRILVTGASGGIGQHIAEQAARLGARVFLTARSTDRLQALAERLRSEGLQVWYHPADVTQGEDRQSLRQAVQKELSGLDVLVNNAGVCSFGHFLSGTEAILRRVMEVNFFAPAEMIRLFFPLLKEGSQPAVVNVASKLGRRALPAFSEYSASKFALVGLTEALRAEGVLHTVRFLLVLPGMTRSEMGENLLRNEGKMQLNFEKGMPVEEVARGVLNALIHDRKESTLGWDAWWLLWGQRFLPNFLDYMIGRRVRQLYGKA